MSASSGKGKRAAGRDGNDSQLGTEKVEAAGILDGLADDAEKAKGLEATLGRRSATAGPTAEPMTRLQRLESVFRIGSLAAISASAVLAAFQFYQERLDARKERSTDLMLTWQTADARDAYARLRGALEVALLEQGPIPANIPETAYDDIKYNIGQTLIKEWQSDSENEFAKWSVDIEIVYQFYTEVEFCMRAELCDEDLLTAYFSDEVVSFWDYFEYFAEFQRDGLYPSYGVSVEKLVAVFNGKRSVEGAPE